MFQSNNYLLRTMGKFDLVILNLIYKKHSSWENFFKLPIGLWYDARFGNLFSKIPSGSEFIILAFMVLGPLCQRFSHPALGHR